jgi:hypothetical protein
MPIRKHFYFYSCLAFVLLLPLVAVGQYGRNRGQQQPKPVDVKGTIARLGGGQIMVKGDEPRPTLVQVVQMTKVRLVGTANADYIQPRLFVEFVADLDKTGTAQKDVEQLTVCSPSADRGAGLFPEGEAGKKDKDADADAGAKPKKKPKGKKDADADAGGGDAMFGAGSTKPAQVKLPAVCTVRGLIKSLHGNKVTVAAGRASVKATLAETPTIDVDMADLRAAQAGDSITVSGERLPNGIVVAETVRIDCANPLQGSKKRSSHGAAKTDKPAAKKKADDSTGDAK